MSKKKTHHKMAVAGGKPRQPATPAARGASRQGQRSRKAKSKAPTLFANRWLWYVLGGTAMLAILVGAYWAFMQDRPVALAEQISAQEAFQKYQDGAYFLDVRSPQEFQDIHIPNSTMIPLDELKGRLAELPRDRDIVVVCLSGKRSLEGRKILAEAGFDNVSCLRGGIQEWQAAGFETASG
jgi:rhodanese-related sulfurtransferase